MTELASDEHKRAVEERVGSCGRLATDLQAARGALEQLTKAGETAERDAQRAAELVALLRLVTVPSEVAELARIAPAGTFVYVSAVATRPLQDIVDSAIRLRAAGFKPVPHVAVRMFASAAALDDVLEGSFQVVNLRTTPSSVLPGRRRAPTAPARPPPSRSTTSAAAPGPWGTWTRPWPPACSPCCRPTSARTSS